MTQVGWGGGPPFGINGRLPASCVNLSLSPPMTKVAIVVINYNGKDLLSVFLPSLVKLSPGCKVYVIDNASSDGSAEYVRTFFPKVGLISLEKKPGL